MIQRLYHLFLRASEFLHDGGARKRVLRGAEPELGKNEVFYKPWHWFFVSWFKYDFFELREVKKFPGNAIAFNPLH